ncbi:MBL fold metallo-hydrolase [Agilicoccus flavus]|uniref:MBL fold metallo-hydrolase n=1 Tax=Agilicoccus flavus TaxID=2775968 RepID=UPI001CF646E5|nr:MBL fold metallo-hydrolase [Agilicoccus flavus]
MQLTSYGHSCVLVEVADTRILIDPGTFAVGWEDVRDLDAVLVTHAHPDHCDVDRLPALLAGNAGARVLAEASTAADLREAGHDVEALASGTPVELGPVRVDPVGHRHAVIHEDIPRIDNAGVVLRAEGEPSLFHPGDALDADPGQVDVLAVPVCAPWCAMKETVEFVRRIGAPAMIPVHDALLSDVGRELFLRQVANLGAGDRGVGWTDLRGRGAVRVG